MNVLDISNGEKIVIVSIKHNYFNEEVYTKYSIIKNDNKLYIIYRGRHLNGKEIVSINTVNDIYSEKKEEGVIIKIPNEIILGNSLSGTYENNLNFNFENIIAISKETINEIEKELVNKGEFS